MVAASGAGGPDSERHADAGGTGLAVTIPEVEEVDDELTWVPTVDLTNDAVDIWDRIRRGFGMPDLATDEVERQQLAYLSNPSYLDRAFERGRPFLYHIVAELEARGMPTELALLPMVESAYNPRAFSRARAAGLWQFIPSTGRVFNLEQNAWVDERRDVVASTAAALDYLQYIYEMHGDWHLALASYNWGEGAVGRALKKNSTQGKPLEYAHLKMPRETSRYVPKLQALKNIVARPELYGIELPYVANKTHFETVDSPPGLDLATAADFAGIPLEEFVALNPALKRPIIPEGTQPIVLPADSVETFRANFALSGDAATRWRSYAAQRKDTLRSVANRFKVSLVTLAEVNGLRTGARLKPGQKLLVPVGDNADDALRAARALPDEPKIKKRRYRKRAKRRSR
ncbi:MAG: transglycosylase SLT domain-containing protein [Rhodocyclaceae bacterium]|nr:transglycosylase SLT domain-containing protein [Rhodocyclaceae bacterium]